MQITSLLDIIDGRLLNQPSISFIYSIKTTARKVKEGDLFIVQNKEGIKEALENGAFALIVDEDTEIIDNEVAWIKVRNLNEAIIKLIRFQLSNKKLTAFYCNSVSYDLFEILKKPTTHSQIKLIPKDLSKFFKFIDDIEDNDTIISSCQKTLENIYPVNFDFNTKQYEIKNLIEHSIFETTFSYQDRYFSKIKIPSLYLKEFLDVYSFLGFDADLNKLKKFNKLRPIFVDKLINHTDYGRTDKFLLAQENKQLVEEEIKYLKNKYKYAKILYFTFEEETYTENIEYIHLTSLTNIKAFLKKNSFNAAYFVGLNYDTLYEQVSKENNEPTLI
ncbi:MAG: peptidoglycan synthetase [Campylobacteraceae bacterium]|nr:peptidoglycan synthetase [Campylobacteraceae bacterium]